MKQSAASIAVFLSLFLLVMACGRMNDKFGRLKSDYTRVQFKSSHSGMQVSASQNGGLMIYFARNGNSNSGGNAFAFPSEAEAMGQTLVVPNGSFKVYAFSNDGSSGVMNGQTRCAFGNGGADVNLTGTNVVVTLDLTQANCSFGSDSAFSNVEASRYQSGNATNFDTLHVSICDNNPSSCTPVTSSSYGVKIRVFAGEKQPGLPMFIANQSLTTSCASLSGASADTSFRIPVGPANNGPGVSPPIGIVIYGNPSCSSAPVAQYDLTDGLSQYYNAASSSNVYVSSPGTDTKTYLKLFKNF